MKICFLSSLYSPFEIGGAEIYVRKVAEGLVKRGHEVQVITVLQQKNSKTQENINGVSVYRVEPFNLYPNYDFSRKPLMERAAWHLIDLWNMRSYQAIKHIIEIEKPDIIHINNFTGLSSAIFNLGKSLDIPLVFTPHDYALICLRTTLLKSSLELCTNPPFTCRVHNALQKYLVDGKPDAITPVSNFLFDKLSERGLFLNMKPVVLKVPVILNPCRTVKSYGSLKLLYAGRFDKQKGIYTLIEAFRQLHTQNVSLDMVGTGPEFENVKKIVSEYQNITLHGFIPNDKIQQFYQTANLVIVPSLWYDMAQFVIAEAFNSSTPVIGSNIGGIPEVINNGHNGFLFTPGDAPELRDTIDNALSNTAQLKQLEEGAYQSSQLFSIELFLDRLLEIYRNLV